jgi:hypothetical protein
MAVLSEAHRPRRQPRVAYSAPVRLSGDWSDREPCFVPLLAQSLDLSESGMALVTPLPLQAGSIVTCSMRVGGCQLYVVGSVRWERMADDGMRRAGIEFLPPNHEDTGLMRRLLDLGKLHPHRIHMRFDGRPDTLTALAQVTRSGLSLTAPLPILRRDTGVRFAFANKNGASQSFHGQIDRVRLAQLEGMPALQVGIRVPNAQTLQDAVHDAQRAREDATPRGVEVTTSPGELEPPAIAARVRELIDALQRRVARVRLPIPLAVALGVCALATGALTRELSQAPRQATLAVPAEPAPRAQELPPVVTIAPLVEIEAPEPTLAPAPSRELVYKWRKMRREIFIPIAGELGALEHYRIDTPAGIAIDLPATTVTTAQERYAVRRPGVSRVDITPRAEGTRIRVWVHAPFTDYRVEAVRGGLRFTLPGPFQAR